jgi:hypothetical protein
MAEIILIWFCGLIILAAWDNMTAFVKTHELRVQLEGLLGNDLVVHMLLNVFWFVTVPVLLWRYMKSH